MNKTVYHVLSTLFFACVLAMPLSAQAPFPHLIFHAELSGSEEIPAVTTNGKALVTLLYTPDRTKVTVSGMLVHLQGIVTEAKIHIGQTGQTGAVLLDLMPLIDSRRIEGQLNAPPELLQNLLHDRVYAEIKTTAHPNGEIRGQFLCETDVDFGVSMSGDQLVPAAGTPAIAFGGIHFPLGAEDVIYAFTVTGLSGPITAVELYEGQPGSNGTLVKVLPKPLSNFIQGLIYLDTMPADFIRRCREGHYYMVIKTASFPDGELRGHINHLGYFCSLAPINGVQQVPTQFTQGFGFNHTRLNATLDSLITLVYISNIVPTSVKIHIGPPGQIGPDFEEMDPQVIPGFYFKKYKITDAQLTDFAQGRLYINVTTTAVPAGEIRGVMKNTLRKGYAFDLCGSQVVPPNTSHALGVAVASVDQADCYLNYKLIADGLHGAPSDANIGLAYFGINGPDIYPLPTTTPIIKGDREIMTQHGPIIEDGGTYMYIVTPNYPDGEIRGQIRRGITCPNLPSGVTALNDIGGVQVSPVPFREVLNLELESASAFDGRLVLRDIFGIIAATQSVQIQSGKQQIQLSTEILPKGIYALSLEIPSQNASVLLKKVIRVE